MPKDVAATDDRLPREFEHELMNLLAVAAGHADLLVVQADTHPHVRQTARAIRAACEKAAALARDWPDRRPALLRRTG